MALPLHHEIVAVAGRHQQQLRVPTTAEEAPAQPA
jgi:hypothetical protein